MSLHICTLPLKDETIPNLYIKDDRSSSIVSEKVTLSRNLTKSEQFSEPWRWRLATQRSAARDRADGSLCQGGRVRGLLLLYLADNSPKLSGASTSQHQPWVPTERWITGYSVSSLLRVKPIWPISFSLSLIITKGYRENIIEEKRQLYLNHSFVKFSS